MKKKLISSVIASAAAMSAVMAVNAAPKPNAAVGLDNPLDTPPPSCEQTGDGFDAHWYDPDDDEGNTKYGGDIEFEALLSFVCEDYEESFEGSETATVDVDLSQDESDPFFYECESTGEEEQVVCWASIDWEDISSAVNDAAEDRFAEQQDECEEQGGYFVTWGSTLESVAFGVKEMNPGHGNGKQNYEKAFAYCEFNSVE
jgi:hypothetical protein